MSERRSSRRQPKKNNTPFDSILDDGWADDVRLKDDLPSDLDTLVFISLDTDSLPDVNAVKREPEETYDEDDDNYTDEDYYDTEEYEEDEEDYPPSYEERTPHKQNVRKKHHSASKAKKTKKRKKKGSPAFLIFMILWLGSLIAIIALCLNYFHDFLIRYEEAYQASRPDLTANELVTMLGNADTETIYHMMTAPPDTSVYETEDDVLQYLDSLLSGRELSCIHRENYTEEVPEYYLEADGYIIGSISLRKSMTEERDYHFPVWYLSVLELYSAAEESVAIRVPENASAYVNGVLLGENAQTGNGEENEKNSYVDPYTTLPTTKDYAVSGLYMSPTVTATDAEGNALPINYDEQSGYYIADFPHSSPDEEAMQNFAVEFVSNYSLYITQDLPDGVIENYFPAGNHYLYLLQHASSRDYFTRHTNATIQNVEIRDFTVYTEDVYSCAVSLEESIEIGWGGSEPEILPTYIRVYVMRFDEGWKVIGIEYC